MTSFKDGLKVVGLIAGFFIVGGLLDAITNNLIGLLTLVALTVGILSVFLWHATEDL